ncbi:golgin subfamily A member 6-like protein 4 [Simochromis diagramma]|uniref:golgin subfamily A member 6-like protein 4 n=1 Tax=Simochromis diagramma TaxID=43689 RepID=UPI001A7E647C|nr:golgin subfamily A member 6-like protein 4 [Simochromis diagramma]
MSTQGRDYNKAAAPQELSLAEMEKKLQEANMVVNDQKEELNSVKESLAEMEKKNCEANMVIKRQEEQLKSVKESLCEMEAFYNVRLKEAGLVEMKEFYEDKLQQERSAHKETEEEFKSFKDRVAGEIELALKTGKSENMNNPVNETRLKEMYEELRMDWAKIKPDLQTTQSDPEEIKASIQYRFRCGAGETKQKKELIQRAFTLNEDSQASQKVHEYTKLTLHNLQLAVYYGFKDTAGQGLHGQEGQTHDDSKNKLFLKCFWLSGLLVLNEPPLQPDWKNHHPGQDAWNIFPQEVTADSAIALCQDNSANVLNVIGHTGTQT